MDENLPKIALVWRGDALERREARLVDSRFSAVAHALAQAGFAPEPCVFHEGAIPAVRAQLLGVAAALVWVNPLQDGLRRDRLDGLLREVADAGVLVSGHPDVIDRMGVKAVLWRTRDLGWGSDCGFHTEAADFAATFPARVAAGPRVLKPNRGNGGQGVWKVEAAGEGRVRVQAADGDPSPRTLSFAALFAARAPDFEEAGGLVDQAFQPRLTEGMVRCYMAGGRCAGFGRQKVRMLAPADAPHGPRLYSGPDDPRFQPLRRLMEGEWTPQLCRALNLAPDDLPLIWDADFLLGPPDAAGADSYVLCEINASSVSPMPDEAPVAIAAALAARLAPHASGTTRSAASQFQA
ncbi:MAG: Cj0069 family protein [Caulobacterales bacterium]|nr:Cj0069 family protein [Caulobacterales bacterium]